MEIKRERDSLARYKHRPTRRGYLIAKKLLRIRLRKNINRHLMRAKAKPVPAAPPSQPDGEVREGVECITLRCTELVSPQRAELGYEYCLKCGEAEAKIESKRKASMVQIPYSKGAYQYIHNPADLIGTNPKRTT